MTLAMPPAVGVTVTMENETEKLNAKLAAMDEIEVVGPDFMEEEERRRRSARLIKSATTFDLQPNFPHPFAESLMSDSEHIDSLEELDVKVTLEILLMLFHRTVLSPTSPK